MLDRIRIFIDRILQSLAAFGAALVSPVEQLVGRATDKVLTASEHVERVESFFGRILWVLLWPFRLLGRVVQILLPAPVYRFSASIAENLQGLLGRIGVGILHLAEMLNLDRVVLGLVWVLQPVWRPLASIGIFLVCWLNTRPYRSALMALPAIVLAALVLGVGTFYSVFGKAKIRANYNQAVRESRESNDFQLRALYDQKLAQLGVDSQLTQFNTARDMGETGQLDEAYQRMRELAPEESAGYPQAHFWIIQQLLSGKLVDSPAENKRLVRLHLTHLNTLKIKSPQLEYIEAMLLKQENQLEKASQRLESIASVIPDAAFERMKINLSLNLNEQAQQDARTVVTHMKSRTRGDAKLDAVGYQQWLAAEEVLGNLHQMRTLLEQWHAMEPANEKAAKLLARVCRRQASSLLRAPLPDQQEIIELWLRASKLDNSPDALLRLARTLYAERESTPVYSQLLTALHESPNTPANLLVAIGTEVAQNEQFQESRPFFAAAIARDDENPVAWNNYGLVLSEGKEPQLEKALDAVNNALELEPKEFRFIETRGQILLKLERWQEAIEDLEYALNGLPNLSEIHESLAVAYAALGQDELARLHKTQAK